MHNHIKKTIFEDVEHYGNKVEPVVSRKYNVELQRMSKKK